MFFISKVEIKGFRSIQNATVKFDKGVNILVGPNGAGKSNLLHAIDYALGTVPLLSDDHQRRSITFGGESRCSVTLTLAFSEQNHSPLRSSGPRASAYARKVFCRSLNDDVETFTVGNEHLNLQSYRFMLGAVPLMIGTSVSLNLDLVPALILMSGQDRLKHIMSAMGINIPTKDAWTQEECLAQLQQEVGFGRQLEEDYRRSRLAAETYEEYRDIEMKLNACKFCILQNDLKQNYAKTRQVKYAKEELLETIISAKEELDKLHLDHKRRLMNLALLEKRMALAGRHENNCRQKEVEMVCQVKALESEIGHMTTVITREQLAKKEQELENKIQDFDRNFKNLLMQFDNLQVARDRRASIILRYEKTERKLRMHFACSDESDDEEALFQNLTAKKNRLETKLLELSMTVSELVRCLHAKKDEIAIVQNFIVKGENKIRNLRNIINIPRPTSRMPRNEKETLANENNLSWILDDLILKHDLIKTEKNQLGQKLFGEHWPTRWMLTMILKLLSSQDNWLASQYCGMLIDLVKCKDSIPHDTPLLAIAGNNLFTVVVKTSEGATRLLEIFSNFSRGNGIYPPLVIKALDSVVPDENEFDSSPFESSCVPLMDLLDYEKQHAEIVDFYFKHVFVVNSGVGEEMMNRLANMCSHSTIPVKLVTLTGKIIGKEHVTAANLRTELTENKLQLFVQFVQLVNDLGSCGNELNVAEINLDRFRKDLLEASTLSAKKNRLDLRRSVNEVMKNQLRLIQLINAYQQQKMCLDQKIAEDEGRSDELFTLKNFLEKLASFEWTSEKVETMQQLNRDLHQLRTTLSAIDTQLESEVNRLMVECVNKEASVTFLQEEITCGEENLKVSELRRDLGEQEIIAEVQNGRTVGGETAVDRQQMKTVIKRRIAADERDIENRAEQLCKLENDHNATVAALKDLEAKTETCKVAISRLQCLTSDSLIFMGNTSRDDVIRQPIPNTIRNQDPEVMAEELLNYKEQLQDPRFEHVDFCAPQSRDMLKDVFAEHTGNHERNCRELSCIDSLCDDVKEYYRQTRETLRISSISNFSDFFHLLAMPYGNAELEIMMDDDEEQGNDSATINVAFHIRENRHRWLSSLSNGEQLIVALALFSAVECSGHTPVILLDELDTHLGPVYKRSLAEFIQVLSNHHKMQIIAASFASDLFAGADCIFSLTMQQKITRIKAIDEMEARRIVRTARR